MSNQRLILYPRDPQIALPSGPLVEQFRQQQLIAEKLPATHGRESFLVGERFFDLFLFLGCSPSIELAPSGRNPESPFCYIQIESEEACRVVAGDNLKAVCPGCKGRYQLDAVLHAPEGASGLPRIPCGSCGVATPAERVAWRKTAAPSRTRISLWNIFEGEAVPSDSLLSTLEQQTGVVWRYSYISTR